MGFQPVYVVDGARTPFLKAKNAPGPFAASDLQYQMVLKHVGGLEPGATKPVPPWPEK